MPMAVEKLNSDLELLLKLQVIDYDLGELERSKEYLPDMIDNLNQEVQEAESAHLESKTELTDCQVKQKSLELEVQTKEANLQKYQQQMMSIKTNKEYDALVAEIDAIKETISGQETDLLITIERISELSSNISELEEKAAQIKENNTKQLVALQAKIDGIGGTMAAKEEGRQEVIQAVSRKTMSVYERVRRGKGGQSVVPVKKKACGSCFKALTPKKIQEVKRADVIYTCDNCGAIFYWDDNVSR